MIGRKRVIKDAVVDMVSDAVDGLYLSEEDQLALFKRLKGLCNDLTDYIYRRK
jgi:hypothetical protein